MPESKTGIADLSSNKYAAAMRELAEGLASWSSLLLPLFYLYQILALESGHFLSWKTLVLIFGGSLLFSLSWRLCNAVLAAVFALPLIPLLNSGKLVMAQNIQNTWMAIFGVLLCVAAWLFVSYTTRYMFS